jgi:hypothetical protein
MLRRLRQPHSGWGHAVCDPFDDRSERTPDRRSPLLGLDASARGVLCIACSLDVRLGQCGKNGPSEPVSRVLLGVGSYVVASVVVSVWHPSYPGPQAADSWELDVDDFLNVHVYPMRRPLALGHWATGPFSLPPPFFPSQLALACALVRDPRESDARSRRARLARARGARARGAGGRGYG